MPKFAPPPSVTPESWGKLLGAAAELIALAPWEYAYDTDVIGLINPISGETRIGCILGNGDEVFAAVIYRRKGVSWLLSMLDAPEGFDDFGNIEGIDCLKVEFVPKRELMKEDLALLKAAAFKPVGRGAVWPQFRSAESGWHPWHLNQTEAEQLIADLPRMTAFYSLLETHPDLYDGRAPTEVPFLPVTMPSCPLQPEDLDWRPLLLPPPTLDPFRPDNGTLSRLHALKRLSDCTCEFNSVIVPGASFMESGRPCFGRCCLLVENRNGLVVGSTILSGALPSGEGAGRGLAETLLAGGILPGEIVIAGSRFQSVLQPLCDELKIRLSLAPSLPALEEALASLIQHLSGLDF